MLDIETLGPGPGSVIASLALVPFNLNGKPLVSHDPLLLNYNIGEQLALGYAIDQNTIEWWMKNEHRARMDAFAGSTYFETGVLYLANYMRSITEQFATYRLWATSAKLDYGCISYTWAKQGVPYPFDHRSEHCARTVRNLTKMLIPNYKLDADKGRNHDAFQDCMVQIGQLQEQYQLLRSMGVKIDEPEHYSNTPVGGA